jgi:hypothetical protein
MNQSIGILFFPVNSECLHGIEDCNLNYCDVILLIGFVLPVIELRGIVENFFGALLQKGRYVNNNGEV